MQKRCLFDDLIRYLERPMAFSSTPKFRTIKFEIEIVTSLDDLIDELVEQGRQTEDLPLIYQQNI